MATIAMPQLGESVSEGTILRWLKKPGDPVKLDDALCEIETEKVTAEFPSPFEGTMGAIHVPEGQTVDVGVPLCDIVEAAASSTSAAAPGWTGGPMAIPPDEAAAVSAPPPPVPAAATAGTVHARTAPGGPRHAPERRERFYSPAVLRLAGEHNLDLATVHGSGIGGRVTRKDVDRAVAGVARPAQAPAMAAAPVSGDGYVTVTLSPTRRTIAEHLKRSNLEAPQAWTMVEADITGLVRLREREKARFLEETGVELTLLPYFTRAVCESLREFPMLNARWEAEELRRYHALNLGIAVATENGLVVPVIHNAADLSVEGLAHGIADLAARAKARKLTLQDVEGGTFTVNNTGAFGSIASKPIVNYPQVAIVTMERAVKRAVVTPDDAIAVRWMVNVCLSFDHRALDGLEAGNFLASLKRELESIA
jgi:2-oxoisovalerate dehydrogenase E2 component (dihydrolipoyl transacylase)